MNLKDMFDLLFNAMMAWNQVLFLAAGLALLGAGGACFWYFFYWRSTGMLVKGRIAGVRMTDKKSLIDERKESAQPVPEEPVPAPSWENFAAEFKKAPGAGLLAVLFALMIVGIPLLFIGFGATFAADYLNLLSAGIETQGVVVDNDYQSDSDGGGTYHVIVSFRDAQGAEWRARDRIGMGGSPSYDIGERVAVHYEAANPEHAVIGGFWRNMLLPAIFIGMGGLVLVLMFARTQAKAPRDAATGKKVTYAGEMYYPVYEYKARNGETVRAEDGSGSNLLGGKIPGTAVRLLVRPDDPGNAVRPGYLSIFFGLLFGGIGGALLYTGFTAWEFNIFTVVMALALIGWLTFQLKKAIKPRDQWETPQAFALRRKQKRQEKRGEGRLLAPQEIKDRLQVQDRNTAMGLPFLVLIAAGLVAGGAYLGRDMQDFLARGTLTAGQVVRIESSRDSDGDYSYYPVVGFDAPGQRLEFRDRQGSNPALYRTGDHVRVLYDPDTPSRAMIDRGIWNWAASGGCFVGGLLLLLLAVRGYSAVAQRRMRR